MNTAALNGLWTYLQTLSLTKKNKEWLAERLIEPAAATIDSSEEETRYIMSSDAMMEIIAKGKKEIEQGKFSPVNIEELWK